MSPQATRAPAVHLDTAISARSGRADHKSGGKPLYVGTVRHLPQSPPLRGPARAVAEELVGSTTLIEYRNNDRELRFEPLSQIAINGDCSIGSC